MSGQSAAPAPEPERPAWVVAHYMSKVPLAVVPHVSVRAAFMKMRIGHFRHLLVVEGGRLVGIVTDRDLRRPDVSASVDGWRDVYRLDDSTTVRDVMTTDVETVAPDDPLSKAVQLFVEHRFGALPVVDHAGIVRGILSTVDVLRAVQKLLP